MSAVLAPSNDDILPRVDQTAAPALKGSGQAVIDNDTGVITFEHKSASLLLAEANAIHSEASDLAPCIDSDVMYSEAGDLLKKITDSFKTLDEERLAATKPLRDKTDEINADYKPAIDKRKDAAQIIKTGMLTYDREVERKRQQAEREARARAEEERRKAEADAAAARKRAEADAAAARQQAEDRATEERRIAENNAARMRAEAAELEAAGNDARAAQLRSDANAILGIAEEVAQTALFEGEQVAANAAALGEMEADAMHAASTMITPAAPTISRPKAAGVSTSWKFKAKLVDQKLALQHVIDNWDLLNHLVTFEQGKLDNLAQNQKERFTFPGCELVKEPSMSARRR